MKKGQHEVSLTVYLLAINKSRSLMEELCFHALQTAKIFEYDPILLGIGYDFVEHKQRIAILFETLKRMDANEIVVFMDGGDTLFNDFKDNLINKFLRMNTGVLISAERDYTHQYPFYKNKFDAIESEYRYVNAGTFMGYAKDLLVMMEDILEIEKQYSVANDQGLLGIWAYNNLEYPEKVKLDSDNEVFWVTARDWQILKDQADTGYTINNVNTATRPCIIHNVGNNDPNLRKSFSSAYHNILEHGRKESFRVVVLSPKIDIEDYPLWDPIRKKKGVKRPVWYTQEHPNIIMLYYSSDEEMGDDTLPTDYVHEAIMMLRHRYYVDYIVHVPKGWTFHVEELYDFITTNYDRGSIRTHHPYDFPVSENFIFTQGRYYEFDGLKRIDWDDVELANKSMREYRAYFVQHVVKELKEGIDDMPFDPISIGGWCGPAITLDSLKLRQEAYPFCMLNSKMECVIEVAKGNSDVLFQIEEYTIMPHHDMDKEEDRRAMERRLARFNQRLQEAKPILFIRSIIHEDFEHSIRQVKEFDALLKQKYGRSDRFVLILHDQGVNTVKLGMVNQRMMLWSVYGKVGWRDSNRYLLFQSYLRIVRYCLNDENWIYDMPQIRRHQILPHSTRQICKHLFDPIRMRVVKKIKYIRLDDQLSIPHRALYVSIKNNNVNLTSDDTLGNHRHRSFIRLLKRILEQNKIQDCDFVLASEDISLVDYGFPVLGYAKWESDPRDIFIVPYDHFETNFIRKMNRYESKRVKHPWNDRSVDIQFVKPRTRDIYTIWSHPIHSLFMRLGVEREALSYYDTRHLIFFEGIEPNSIMPTCMACGICIVILSNEGSNLESDFFSCFNEGQHYLKIKYRLSQTQDEILDMVHQVIRENNSESIALAGADRLKQVYSESSVYARMIDAINRVANSDEQDLQLQVGHYSRTQKASAFISPS